MVNVIVVNEAHTVSVDFTNLFDSDSDSDNNFIVEIGLSISTGQKLLMTATGYVTDEVAVVEKLDATHFSLPTDVYAPADHAFIGVVQGAITECLDGVYGDVKGNILFP